MHTAGPDCRRLLQVGAIMDSPSCCFLWCGSEEGLEAGRHCLTAWGFRRVEDIVWVKTNMQGGRRKYLGAANQDPSSVGGAVCAWAQHGDSGMHIYLFI